MYPMKGSLKMRTLQVLCMFVLRIRARKVVTFSARNTINIYKMWKLRTVIFSVFYNSLICHKILQIY